MAHSWTQRPAGSEEALPTTLLTSTSLTLQRAPVALGQHSRLRRIMITTYTHVTTAANEHAQSHIFPSLRFPSQASRTRHTHHATAPTAASSTCSGLARSPTSRTWRSSPSSTHRTSVSTSRQITHLQLARPRCGSGSRSPSGRASSVKRGRGACCTSSR